MESGIGAQDAEELAAADEREGVEPAPASISMGASVDEGDEMGGGRQEEGKGRSGGAADDWGNERVGGAGEETGAEDDSLSS